MATAMRRMAALSSQVRQVAVPSGRQTSVRSLAAQAEEGPLVKFQLGKDGVANVTLSRPSKLNSLSLPMIRELKAGYQELEKAGARCVILRGEGRALCAGGDVIEVRDGVLNNTSIPADFFFEEYGLDYEIATLNERGIVQVALWDGIVMGGGVGLSAHSPIRIATEKTMFAMPETLIGLFPDVGMTWALSRLPAGAHVGLYLGLTGQRLGAADCMTSGLATHYCPSEKLGDVEARLRTLGADSAGNVEVVSSTIAEVAGGATPDKSKAVLEKNAAVIERCFGAEATSAEDIVSRLEKENCDFSRDTLKNLLMRSPTSVKVSLEAVRRHASVSFKDAFQMEYRISQWCMRKQPDSDFCEGIRAVLIDKDNKPNWIPARLEDVSKERVNEFFAPLGLTHPRGDLFV